MLACFSECPFVVIGETHSLIPPSRKSPSPFSTSQDPSIAESSSSNTSLTDDVTPLSLPFLLVLSTDAEDLDNPAVYLLDPRFVAPTPADSKNCWWSEDKMIPHEYLTNFLASLEPQNDTVFRSTADMDTFIDQQMTLRCELYRKLEVEPPRLNSSIQQGIFFFFF